MLWQYVYSNTEFMENLFPSFEKKKKKVFQEARFAFKMHTGSVSSHSE